MICQREEHVVEIRRADRQRTNVNGGVVEPVEQRAKRPNAAIAFDLESEALVVARDIAKDGGRLLEVLLVSRTRA